MLIVTLPDGKTLNSASGVFYGPIYNGNKTEGSILPSSGSNRNLFLGHKPLPVGSKVTRVSDLEAGSVTLESFMSSEGGHPEKSSDPDDMSAYNKLLGLVSQKVVSIFLFVKLKKLLQLKSQFCLLKIIIYLYLFIIYGFIHLWMANKFFDLENEN